MLRFHQKQTALDAKSAARQIEAKNASQKSLARKAHASSPMSPASSSKQMASCCPKHSNDGYWLGRASEEEYHEYHDMMQETQLSSVPHQQRSGILFYKPYNQDTDQKHHTMPCCPSEQE